MTADTKVVGQAEIRSQPITVQREPEVGVAWEACCLTWSALGATPGEAVTNLGVALRDRGLVDVLNVDAAAIDALVQPPETKAESEMRTDAEYDASDGHA